FCVLPGNRCSPSGSFLSMNWRTRLNAFTSPRSASPATRCFSRAWTAKERTARWSDSARERTHDRRERKTALALRSAGPAAGPSHAGVYFQIARPVYERRHHHLGEQEAAGLRQAQPVQI